MKLRSQERVLALLLNGMKQAGADGDGHDGCYGLGTRRDLSSLWGKCGIDFEPEIGVGEGEMGWPRPELVRGVIAAAEHAPNTIPLIPSGHGFWCYPLPRRSPPTLEGETGGSVGRGRLHCGVRLFITTAVGAYFLVGESCG